VGKRERVKGVEKGLRGAVKGDGLRVGKGGRGKEGELRVGEIGDI
jgi:hypothetical protein